MKLVRAQQHQWIRITANSSITKILWEVWIRIKKLRFKFLLFSLPKSYVLRTFSGWERNNPNGYELLRIHPLQIFSKEMWIRIKAFRLEFLLFSLSKGYVLWTFDGLECNNPNGNELQQIHPFKYFSWGVLAKNKGFNVEISTGN